MRVDRIQPQDLVKLPVKDRVPLRRGARGRRWDRALPTALPRRRLAPRNSPASRRALAQARTTNTQQDEEPTPASVTIPPTTTAPEGRKVTHDSWKAARKQLALRRQAEVRIVATAFPIGKRHSAEHRAGHLQLVLLDSDTAAGVDASIRRRATVSALLRIG